MKDVYQCEECGAEEVVNVEMPKWVENPDYWEVFYRRCPSCRLAMVIADFTSE